ncbi:hypothetical protein C8N46_11116 [Kordia periserrulae]|uniref:Uncharacterized protein n=1 Tax=Kordia periserrulae TaxID=701523 RepID=A0A2T6BSM0_9FLAO|nr:hypothetical protein [Kordia periserrulae]PTX58947.1 hypothetical protein C8N46_11116 [Kordia periserrulae]
MKKKNLKNLSLSKSTVSSLEIKGGNIPSPPSFTCFTWCGGPQCVTAVPTVTCVVHCGTVTYNTVK